MKFENENYIINIIWNPFLPTEDGKPNFVIPKIQFHSYKNKPCVTCWNFDWILTFIYLTIMKKQKRGSVYNMIENVWKRNNKKGDYTHNKISLPKWLHRLFVEQQKEINKYYTSNYWGIEVVGREDDNDEIIFE